MLGQLRALIHAVPFGPFSVVLPNGQALRVPHPDFIWLHPDKKTVMIALPKGGSRILNLQLIVALEMKRARV